MIIKKYLFLVLAVFSVIFSFAQTYTLTFSATDTENSRYQLDSVRILDLSQGWTATLHYPDTIFNLTVGTSGIHSVYSNGSTIEVYPNPAKERTHVYILTGQESYAKVRLYRADGEVVIESNLLLAAGSNRIEVILGGSGIFYMQIMANGEQSVAKLVSLGGDGSCRIQSVVPFRSLSKGENTDTFNSGDIMRITGYATFQNARIESEPFVGNITGGRDITFSLPISYSAPIVTTTDASEVTMTGAVCGGTVMSDGGKPVTTRGVCFSSEREPTVEDNITTNGDGMGAFVAQLDNLQPGTTYLFRAYAFNSRGFSYGETMTFTTPVTNDDPSEDGTLPGVFSVGDMQRVVFSKGNLQYSTIGNHLTASATVETGIWRFAEAQYLYVGEGNAYASETYNGFIDLFGWGTSGWNGGAVAYQPYSTSTANSDYLTMRDIDGSDADWGQYNAIQNGGNTPGMWRVLSSSEWQYLLNEANDARNGKNAEATIEIGETQYNGLLLLPDEFELPDGCQYTAGYANGFSTNQYNLEQWQRMEQAGAVFIVAAGRRNGTDLAFQNARCMYWSGTPNDENSSHILYCVSGALQSNGADQVHIGAAVRLVRSVE